MRALVGFLFAWNIAIALVRIGYAANARFPIRRPAVTAGQHLFGSFVRLCIAAWAAYALFATGSL